MPNSRSFILHQDYYNDSIKKLNMAQRGELFTAIFEFNESGVMPTISDPAVDMAFSFISAQLKRDKKAYAEKCRKSAESIAKRWKSKSESESNDKANDTNVYERMPKNTNGYLYDNDNDNDNDNKNDNVNDNENENNNNRVAAVEHGDTRAHEEKNTVEKSETGADQSYGQYKNVYLASWEMDELTKEFPDLDKRIERLSEYIACKGTKYKNHAAVIRSWAKNGRDISPPEKTNGQSRTLEVIEGVESGFNESDFFTAALKRGMAK